MRGLGPEEYSCFPLFPMKDQLDLRVSEEKYLEEEKGRTTALQTSTKIKSFYALEDRPGHIIITVQGTICMELCNFGKAPNWVFLFKFPLYILVPVHSAMGLLSQVFRNSKTIVSSK